MVQPATLYSCSDGSTGLDSGGEPISERCSPACTFSFALAGVLGAGSTDKLAGPLLPLPGCGCAEAAPCCIGNAICQRVYFNGQTTTS